MFIRYRRSSMVLASMFVMAVTAAAAENVRLEAKPARNRITILEKKTNETRSTVPEAPQAEIGYAPRVTLSLPSTLFGNFESRGKVTWRDSDDRVISVFLTVFFHDGDVATVSLYDTRDGDPPSYSGSISFGITPAAYEPDLGSIGTAIVTVTDERLNFTQMSSSFVVR